VPLDGTLSRVEYDLRVDGESAMGRALLTVESDEQLPLTGTAHDDVV